MKNLKNIIVGFTALTISGCVLRPTTPRFDEIPKGPHCLLLVKKGFCIDESTGREYELSNRQMRGWEAVPIDYKEKLEGFIYDILKENETLRMSCGDNK